MSKSSRKQQQREALQRALEQRLAAIRKHDLPPDELREFHRTRDEMYAILDRVSLPSSVSAKLSHELPTPRSHVGGEMLTGPEDTKPTSNGVLMTGVLELFVDGLPFIPDQLREAFVLQLFLELVDGEHHPEYRDGASCIRLLAATDSIQPESEGLLLAACPLAFTEEKSVPNYPDDLDVIPSELRERFDFLPNWSESLAADYPTAGGLRFGGWPYWIECSGVQGDFVFQVDDDTIGVDLSFDGMLYFGLDSDRGRWHHSWEIGWRTGRITMQCTGVAGTAFSEFNASNRDPVIAVAIRLNQDLIPYQLCHNPPSKCSAHSALQYYVSRWASWRSPSSSQFYRA